MGRPSISKEIMKKKKKIQSKTESSLNENSLEISGNAAALSREETSGWKKFWSAFVGFWTSKSTKEMLAYILKRLILLVCTFLIIFLICFVLVRLLPVSFEGGLKDEEVFYKQMVAQGRYVDNRDGTYSPMPIMQQLWNFLKNLFSGNGNPWGFSYKIQWLASPDEILAKRFPPTVLINVYSMIFSIPLGLGLGIFMALKKNKWQDHALSVLIMLVISVPSFVYAFILQYLFAYVWQILPSVAESSKVGYFSWTYFRSIILPILSMSFGSIAGYARYTRAELTEVLTSDFMLLARTKGLTRGQATVRHAFRNSLVPIFPMILGEVISILSGSMIIENIFAVNGVGGLYLDSINKRDYDVFQFVSMFYILIGLVGTLVVDVSYGIVDPRIRMGGKK